MYAEFTMVQELAFLQQHCRLNALLLALVKGNRFFIGIIIRIKKAPKIIILVILEASIIQSIPGFHYYKYKLFAQNSVFKNI